MSILHRYFLIIALVWQIIRLSLPAKVERKHVVTSALALIMGAVGVSVYLNAPRLLKTGDQVGDEAVVRELHRPNEIQEAPAEKPSQRASAVAPVGDLSRPGSRFPYPSPEKSPFEVARTPVQAPAPASAQKPASPQNEQDKPPNEAWIKGRDQQDYYLPLIGFGRDSATNVIYFIWGVDELSRTIFQSYIDPAIKKIIRKSQRNLKINMVQIVGSEQYGVADPGSMFFCAPNAFEYAGVALGYLRSGGNIKKIYKGSSVATSSLYFNEISELTLRSAGYAAEKCASDMAFFRQLQFAAIESTVLEKLLKSPNKPTLIFKGKPVDLQNKDALRRFAREVR